MTYENLKKNAVFLGEVDFSHDDNYAGTDYYYLFRDRLYCRHQPTNAFTYDGKIKTDEVPFDNLQQDLKKHSFARFDFLSVEIYQKLCRIYNTETRFGMMYEDRVEKEGISDAELDEFMQGVILPTPKIKKFYEIRAELFMATQKADISNILDSNGDCDGYGQIAVFESKDEAIKAFNDADYITKIEKLLYSAKHSFTIYTLSEFVCVDNGYPRRSDLPEEPPQYSYPKRTERILTSGLSDEDNVAVNEDEQEEL